MVLLQMTLTNPMKNRMRRDDGRFGANANAMVPTAQAELVRMATIGARITLPTNAQKAAPTASPPPRMPVIRPNPSPPLSKTSIAYSGMRGNTARPKRLVARSMTMSQGSGWERPMWRSPMRRFQM